MDAAAFSIVVPVQDIRDSILLAEGLSFRPALAALTLLGSCSIPSAYGQVVIENVQFLRM